MSIRRLNTQQPDFAAKFSELVAVDSSVDPEITRRAEAIVQDVRARGDEAVLEYTNRFDHMDAKSVAEFRLTEEDLKEALETLLHTRDGQLCDIMIDKAALEAIRKAGKESGEPIIENYADTMVAIADIKIAVRSRKTGKSADFMRSAMAECDGVNVEQLIRAALAGEDEIAQYLEGTAYAKGAQALRESASAFERWCDNRMIEMLKPQKYEAFSVGPLLGYLIARETEIKTVRIILTGKQNGFSDEAIRERIREMYV